MILMQRSELGVLSPDGTTMLSNEGETIELKTRVTHQYPGFQVPNGQRVASVRFSPSRRYAALMIHVRSQIDKVPGVPGLSSARHWWSLRIVDLKIEKRVGEFPASPHAGVAFSPDESSFIYSKEEHSIVRRDLPDGRIVTEYQPAVGGQGGVGITVSADGKLLAVGEYHGQMFLWETQSGTLIRRHQFVRADGEKDIFFQAKLLRFAPDGEFLAVASDNRLKIIETKTGEVLKTHYHERTPSFVQMQWSSDGQKIILLTYSEPARFVDSGRLTPRPTADMFPRVYEWEWRSGDPRLKTFL